MSDGHEIGAEDLELPAPLARAIAAAPPPSEPRTRTPSARPVAAISPVPGAPRASAEYKAAERERILSALTACNWNRVAGREDDRRPAAHVLPAAQGVRDPLSVAAPATCGGERGAARSR